MTTKARPINWIIEEHSKWDKVNGNTYMFAKITNTRTGKVLAIKSTSRGNVAHLLHQDNEKVDGTQRIVTIGHNQVKTIEIHHSPSDWNRLKKHLSGFDGVNSTFPVYDWEATPKILRSLKSTKMPEYVDAQRVKVA